MNGVFGISYNALNIVKDRVGIGTNMPEGRFHFEEVTDTLNAPDFAGVGFPNERGIKFVSSRLASFNTANTPPIDFIIRVNEFQSQTWRLVANSSGLRIASMSGAHDTHYMRTATTYFIFNTNGLNVTGSVSASTQIQSCGSTTIGTTIYRLTNAGGSVAAKMFLGSSSASAGSIRLAYDETNQLMFAASNGTYYIPRAIIGIATLTNTAGSESGDLFFSTQSGGASATERARIGSNGTLSSTGQARFGITSGSSTIINLYTTNGGGAITTGLLLVGRGLTFSAGVQTLQYEDTTNRLHFVAANGTRHISRASIGIDSLTNSAGSETASMVFYTKPSDTAEVERWRISYAGCFNNMASHVDAYIALAGSTTTYGLFFINGDSALMTTPQAGFIDSDNMFLYYTNPSEKRLQVPLVENCILLDDYSATATTTLANVNYLVSNLAQDYKYKFKATLYVRSSSGGFKVLLTGTAVDNTYVEISRVHITSTISTSSINSTIGGNTITEASAGDFLVEIDGWIDVMTTGTLRIQFAQNSSDASPSMILTGSSLIIEQTS